jgi:hypothetical protein
MNPAPQDVLGAWKPAQRRTGRRLQHACDG